MKKSINNSYQLFCSLECPKSLNSTFCNFAIKASSFLEDEFLPVFGELIVKLDKFIANPQNMEFLQNLVEYTELERSKGKMIYIQIIVSLSELNKKLINLISEKKICWELDTELDSLISKSSSIDLYYELKNAADFCNKGIRFSYNLQKYSFLEAFSNVYNIGYGYPISLKNEHLCDISQYITFLEELKKQIGNLELGFAESFFLGESFLRNVIKTLFLGAPEVLRNRGDSFNPCVKQNGEIYFNSKKCGKESQIGFVNDFLDISKIDEIQQKNEKNSILCPNCKCNKICPSIIPCNESNHILINIIEICKSFVADVNNINPDVVLYLTNKNY